MDSVIRFAVLAAILRNGLVEACPFGDSSTVGTSSISSLPTGVFYWSDQLSVETGCTGTIDSVRYCYYNTPNVTRGSKTARFALYRRTGTMYNRFSDIFTITNRLSADSSMETLVCEVLELGTAIQVQGRDVFGVCLPEGEEEPEGEEGLPILSNSPGTTLSRLSCDDGQPLNSFSRFRFNSVTVNNIRLHIFAEAIVPTTAVPLTTVPPTVTEIETDSGVGSIPGVIGGGGQDQDIPQRNGGEAGRAAGITLAILFVLLLTVLAVVTVVVLVWKKKKLLYHIKPKSTLARNKLSTASTKAFATSEIDYVEEGDNYAQITESNMEESVSKSENAPTTAVYENPVYFVAKRKPSRGKNSEGYYCPAAVMYSELLLKDEMLMKRDSNPYEAPASQEEELYGQLKQYNITKINRSELEAQEHLGSGQFGSVEKGLWRRNGKELEVAMKTLMESEENNQNKLKLLQEAVVMAQFQHPNVLYLYGVARQGQSIVIVTELAHRGDLRENLHSIKSDPSTPRGILPKLLLSFSLHITHGMEYLSSKGFIHRDLAARNILVTDSNICKVADFGMSRDLLDENYYVSTGGRVPLKWTAPESLHYSKYSTASDVWSYGCVLYEIWSLGRKPFSKTKNEAVIEYIDAGKRLTPPPGTPRAIYQMMISCWHPDTSSRPSFSDVIAGLQEDDKLVLHIPPEDETSHPNATTLGAPLEAGALMYPDLCTQYSRYSTTADEDSEDDNVYDMVEVVQD